MTDCYTVRSAETVWEAQGLLDSLANTSLSPTGAEEATRVGKQLVPHELTVVYAGPGEAEQEMAKRLAKELGVKVRTDKRLGEVNLGLWQGLTIDEIRRRQPRLCKQWLEAPSGVRPPGGESLAEAQQRLCEGLAEVAHRERKTHPAIVLGPIAYGLLDCRLSGSGLDDVWRFTPAPTHWQRRDLKASDLRKDD